MILGFDMSSTCIGWALTEHGPLLRFGHFDLEGEIDARCSQARGHILAMLDTYKPMLVVIERPVARFAKSVIPQARVSGAVLAALSERQALWVEVTPGEAKIALCDDAHATKTEMVDEAARRCEMPREIRKVRGKVWACSLTGAPLLSEDEADAYGLALAGLTVNVETQELV